MADILNFDRQYRFSAGQAGGSGFEGGESAQVPIPLHCEFSFQKTDLTSQNKVAKLETSKVDLSEIEAKLSKKAEKEEVNTARYILIYYACIKT